MKIVSDAYLNENAQIHRSRKLRSKFIYTKYIYTLHRARFAQYSAAAKMRTIRDNRVSVFEAAAFGSLDERFYRFTYRHRSDDAFVYIQPMTDCWLNARRLFIRQLLGACAVDASTESIPCPCRFSARLRHTTTVVDLTILRTDRS